MIIKQVDKNNNKKAQITIKLVKWYKWEENLFDIKTNALQTLPDLSQICDEFSGVISLFHEHDLELDILADGLRSNSFYIGALGSRKTHAARVEYLKTNGFGEVQIERIHGPVGVDIKASNPREIGVSIIAEAVDRLNILIESLEPI